MEAQPKHCHARQSVDVVCSRRQRRRYLVQPRSAGLAGECPHFCLGQGWAGRIRSGDLRYIANVVANSKQAKALNRRARLGHAGWCAIQGRSRRFLPAMQRIPLLTRYTSVVYMETKCEYEGDAPMRKITRRRFGPSAERCKKTNQRNNTISNNLAQIDGCQANEQQVVPRPLKFEAGSSMTTTQKRGDCWRPLLACSVAVWLCIQRSTVAIVTIQRMRNHECTSKRRP